MEPLMLMEDEEESGQAHELREIEPNTWSNGHLRFDHQEDGWNIVYTSAPRNGSILGRIRWNSVWKEYVFRPKDELVLAHDCLADISSLLKILTARRLDAIIQK
jgi:hypothetical protein